MKIHPKDWPAREQALAIVDTLRSGKANSMKSLGELTGIPDIELAIERCFYVYGYPELDRCAEMIAEAFMSTPTHKQQQPASGALTPKGPKDQAVGLTYGFNPRTN